MTLRHPSAKVLAATAAFLVLTTAFSASFANGAETVKLTFATWLPTQDQWPTLFAEFQKDNPNVEIDFQRYEDFSAFKQNLDNLILADEVPELFGIQVGAAFDDYAEFAMPVSEYASDWIDKVNPGARYQTTTSDGDEKAVAVLTGGMEFYLYNKTLMDEIGVALPTNYEELVKVSQTARENGYSPFAMGAADSWHDSDFFVWLSNQYAGGDVYKAAKGEIPWDSDSLVSAAKSWQKLFTDGVFQDGATTTSTYPQARDDYFMARKAIAMPTGSWHVGAALTTSPEVPGTAIEGDEIGMAVFPTVGPNDAGVTQGVDFALAISDTIDEEKKAAAAKFVEFMAVGTGQQDWVNTLQGFPVAKDVEIQLGDNESELGRGSVDVVVQALSQSTFDRKLAVRGKDSLENDLGVVLQNIAGGADPKSELATLN